MPKTPPPHQSNRQSYPLYLFHPSQCLPFNSKFKPNSLHSNPNASILCPVSLFTVDIRIFLITFPHPIPQPLPLPLRPHRTNTITRRHTRRIRPHPTRRQRHMSRRHYTPPLIFGHHANRRRTMLTRRRRRRSDIMNITRAFRPRGHKRLVVSPRPCPAMVRPFFFAPIRFVASSTVTHMTLPIPPIFRRHDRQRAFKPRADFASTSLPSTRMTSIINSPRHMARGRRNRVLRHIRRLFHLTRHITARRDALHDMIAV